MPISRDTLCFASFVLLAIAAALGVAGQNLVGGLCGFLLLVCLVGGGPWNSKVASASPFKWPVACAALYLGSIVAATLLNPLATSYSLEFLAGYMFWLLLPIVAWLARPQVTQSRTSALFAVVVAVTAICGLVAVSQLALGWKFEGMRIVGSEFRGRGLYSHPLSLAYAVIFVAPAAIVKLIAQPRKTLNWVFFISMLVIVFATKSRVVQVVVFALILFNLVYSLRGWRRIGVMVFTALAVLTIGVTKNPVGDKFRGSLAGEEDRQSNYWDDRLAFWHAYSLMVKERPMIGHGDHVDEAYRKPFYEVIGLGNFSKQYPAHNMYLQIAVNGGSVALVLFLGWYVWQLFFAWKRRRYFWGFVGVQTLLAFGFAGLTQNAFQDSVVRFCLTLFIAGLWISLEPRRPVANEVL